jgi:hypothetical protein
MPLHPEQFKNEKTTEGDDEFEIGRSINCKVA